MTFAAKQDIYARSVGIGEDSIFVAVKGTLC